MMKLNRICASVLVAIGASASAGTITTATAGGTPFAIENFRGSAASQETLGIRPGAVSYSLSTITAVNPGASVFFTVRLTGGLFTAAPAIGTFSFAGAALAAPAANTVGGVVTLSTDRRTVQVEVRNQTANTITLGLGAFSFTPAVGAINGVNQTLSTVGGTVTATIGLTTIAPSSLEATADQTTVDGPMPTAPIAVGAKAITGTVSNLSSLNYNGRINLAASPAASAYTNTANALVSLGSVRFVNNTGTQALRDGTTDFTLAAGNSGANQGATITVAPASGQSFPIGAVLSLHTSVDCNAAVGGTTGTGTTAFTGATAGTSKTLVTTTAVTTGTDWFVCLSAPSAGNTATPITATITADVLESETNELIDNATGTGFALNYNGSQVDVKNYFPNALAAFGYGSYIRVINTGSIAAVISGSFINEATGVAGQSYPLSSSVAAGGAITLRGNVIESILGAPGSADRPRLRLTAPTNSMTVQYYLQNPDGTITEISSSQ